MSLRDVSTDLVRSLFILVARTVSDALGHGVLHFIADLSRNSIVADGRFRSERGPRAAGSIVGLRYRYDAIWNKWARSCAELFNLNCSGPLVWFGASRQCAGSRTVEDSVS